MEDTSKKSGAEPGGRRRKGDTIEVDGGYQHRAATSGNAVQRFWHTAKTLAIGDYLPPAPGDFVLDAGCGSGVVSAYLAQTARRVVGIDGSASAIAYARETFSTPNLSFMQGLVDEDFPVDEPVDKIYCLEVIEHIHAPQAVAMLTAFRRLLRPGGQVFLTTPNYRSLWPLIEKGMDLFHLAPHLDSTQHVTHYSPGRLRRLCGDAGFTVQRQRTFLFVAPWLAPLSWGLALKCHAFEKNHPYFPGSLIVCVLAVA